MNVIITGVSKGMGKAIALKFAEAGHTIIGCARGKAALLELEAEIKNINKEAAFLLRSVNVAVRHEVDSFIDFIANQEAEPDILINNAALYVPGKLYTEEEGVLQKLMETNLYAPYHLIRAVLPGMIKRRKGHIFNICSVAALCGMAHVGSYGVSKYALLGLTHHLRQEMKPFNVKVTAVIPGATFTNSWNNEPDMQQQLIQATDIAAMVYACSQLSPQAVVEDIVIRPQSYC